MSNLVVVATADKLLRKGISTRLLHPSIGLGEIEYLEDAVELSAFLNTTEVCLVLLDTALPKLTKSLIKNVGKECALILVTDEAPDQRKRFGLSARTLNLAELISALRAYRSVDNMETDDSKGELILVAAAASASGATSVAMNFALQMSKRQDVMLVDFDLTHPSLAAQLNQSAPSGGLKKVMQLVLQEELSPAELALNCVALSPSFRLLLGGLELTQLTELDYSLIEEIIDAAVQLDDVVILDLGQILSYGSIAQLQQLLAARASRVLLVCAADPISILTSCNWLSGPGNKFQNKLEVVINKLDQKSSAAELANLVTEAINAQPVAYLPISQKLFREAVWSGKIVSDLKPKSEFARIINRWLSQPDLPSLPAPIKKKRLERLKQVS
jgi:MinD-like ATPase involved in chromosome partitioning or flagellar assembly